MNFATPRSHSHAVGVFLERERVCVLFIGTQFSILYTSMYSPAEAAIPRA